MGMDLGRKEEIRMRIEAYTQVQQVYGAKSRTQPKVRILTRFRSPVSVRISRRQRTRLPRQKISEAS